MFARASSAEIANPFSSALPQWKYAEDNVAFRKTVDELVAVMLQDRADKARAAKFQNTLPSGQRRLDGRRRRR